MTDDDGVFYAPVFNFVVPHGRTYTIASYTGSNPPDFKIGKRVNVLYEKGNPENAKINSVGQLWLIEIVFGIMGLSWFLRELLSLELIGAAVHRLRPRCFNSSSRMLLSDCEVCSFYATLSPCSRSSINRMLVEASPFGIGWRISETSWQKHKLPLAFGGSNKGIWVTRRRRAKAL